MIKATIMVVVDDGDHYLDFGHSDCHRHALYHLLSSFDRNLDIDFDIVGNFHCEDYDNHLYLNLEVEEDTQDLD